MQSVATNDVRLRGECENANGLKAGEYVGIRSSARKPLVQAAIGLASVTLAGSALAQEALPTIEVSGQGEGQAQDSPDNTLQSTFGGISRLPGRVQDIPQTINVINQQTLQQQGVTTVDQALRNVPGVTASSGEGGGGMNGDQFRIRGFQAKGDVYVDGLRDFGSYTRDAFSIEQIQVLKGPASQSFGYGTTGGAINLQQKAARLGDFTDIEGTVGNGPLGRVVADINKQIGETSALRIVGMYHDQDLVGRDHLFNDRWGVLGSVGFGLGTGTQLTLNYMHQSGHRRPDMGTPIALTSTSLIGKPLPEYGVPRNFFYGKNTDNDRTTVDMFTARFKHDVNNWLTITNDTRFAYYTRFFAQTATSCQAGPCGDAVNAGNLNVNYATGGPAGYDQTTKGAQNITTAIAKFNTGFLRHELIAGVDVNSQDDTRFALFNNPNFPKVGGPILNPVFNYPGSVYVNPLANTGIKESDSFNLGVFGSDRVWLTEQFSILGGVRWDRFDSKYARTGSTTVTGTTPGVFITPDLESKNEFVSPKASAIWEPTKEQTYYVTWARSYSNLAGQYVAMDNAPIGNQTLQPEQNDLWEAGLKWSMLNGKLGFTAAWFQVTKDNSIQVDPTSGLVVATNETQRVKGIELGLTGKITDKWDVQAAYAYMDSEILSALPVNAKTIGNRVAFVPDHSASLWTTYDIASLLNIPGKMLVGGGLFYTSQYFVNSFSTAEVPDQITTNLLWSYEYQKYRLALNVYNLFDEITYDAAFGNRAVVGAGRTITLTGGVRW